MLHYMKIEDNALVECADAGAAVWIHAEQPTPAELDAFCRMTDIPAYLLKDALDEDEMPHMDTYGENAVLFLDMPLLLEEVPKNQTRTLCIVRGENCLYSLSNWQLGLAERTMATHLERVENRGDVLLAMVWAMVSSFITALKRMEKDSNWDHEAFKNPTQKENVFFELLDYQKSLIDFETSIKANYTTLQKFYASLGGKLPRHQQLLVENLIVELEQVGQMCRTFEQVLDATAGIAESIVSNNLNDVMKALTSLTIVFSLPTIITGLYMTNTQIPPPYNHFLMPVFLSLALIMLGLLFFKRRKML